jgi:hypothetical protein
MSLGAGVIRRLIANLLISLSLIPTHAFASDLVWLTCRYEKTSEKAYADKTGKYIFAVDVANKSLYFYNEKAQTLNPWSVTFTNESISWKDYGSIGRIDRRTLSFTRDWVEMNIHELGQCDKSFVYPVRANQL